MTGWLAQGWSWLGAFLGLLLGLGCWLVLRGLPRSRRPGLEARMAPYLRDTTPPSGLLGTQPPPVLFGFGRLLGPGIADAGRRLERLLGGGASVRRRQLRAGMPADVDGFRAEQVVWGVVGGATGLLLGMTFMASRRGSPVGILTLVLLGVAAGVFARDRALTAQANRREERMLAEFPTVAELLALAVAAGEGATGALERVCRLSGGELAKELRICLADARAGANLATALQGLADRTGLPSLTRFVDGMVVAVQRGTPLAEVLRAQARDVREAGRRAVMESGGRKEIAMMVPVIFLVLPITVLFALFPGLSLLQMRL